MKEINTERFANRLLTGILIVFLLLSMFPWSTPANAALNESEPIVVSLGDSFSSGEGIEDFYDQNLPMALKVQSEDWLAHRSENSWPGQLKLGAGNKTYALSTVHHDNWYFEAVSGAVTANLKTTPQQKKYSKKDELGTKLKDTVDMPLQLDVFKQLPANSVDYVTITIGGNDMGFADVITSCVVGSPYLGTSILAEQIAFTWAKFYLGGIQRDINQAYSDIAAAAGPQAHIIVAGYPRLLDEYGKGLPISFQEATIVNNAVSNFNNALESLITKRQKQGMKISFVSVEDAFWGRGAYSGDHALINEVMLGAESQDLKDWQISSAYSMHPNKAGAAVYAECVQKLLSQLEEERLSKEAPTRQTSDERDVVLVLDTSGSMSGTPISEVKKASSKFVDTVLKEDASIGIVTYNSSSQMRCDFSMDAGYLDETINSIWADGQTNIEAGLSEAALMLGRSEAKKKIIVLMSDGAPNWGKTGDELVEYANELKEDGIYLYTLGFFDYSDSSQCQQLMEQMASEGCHYEVSSADDLVFFFEDIADQISGQRYIYVRIACPVDVTVKYGGETLRSREGKEKTRTDFGTLTFETNPEEAEDGSDNRIKILRLKEGAEYDIQIEGNGRGTMDYTIGFMDEDGEYSDLRKFKNIKITRKTVIDTVAEVSDTTTLKVDEDGDGSYDLEYEAEANSRGQLVESNPLLWILIILAVVIAGGLVILIICRKKKKKSAASREETAE